MASQFQTMQATGDRNAVVKAFRAAQDDDRAMNGQQYSGGFGQATGIVFASKSFTEAEAAEAWLDENCEKWGPAIAVRCLFEDGERYVIGALCAS